MRTYSRMVRCRSEGRTGPIQAHTPRTSAHTGARPDGAVFENAAAHLTRRRFVLVEAGVPNLPYRLRGDQYVDAENRPRR